MNLKIVIAAAILISGGSYVSQAQTKTGVSQSITQVTAKAFNSKVSAYQNEKDATKSATLLNELKQQMIAGMASLKTEIATAGPNGDKATLDKLMKKNELRVQAMSEANKLSRTNPVDKLAVVSALKKYAATL